jgi:hypothetical protein
LERSFHLDAEPVLDAAGNKKSRDQEEQDGGHKGQGNKGHDQFGLELGPEDFLLPLKDQFDYIAQDEEKEKNQKEDIETDEGDQKKIARKGSLDFPGGDMGLKNEKKPHHRQEQEDDDHLPSSPFCPFVTPFVFGQMRVWIHPLIPSLAGLPAVEFFLKSFNILPCIGEKSKDQRQKRTSRRKLDKPPLLSAPSAAGSLPLRKNMIGGPPETKPKNGGWAG